MSREKGFALLAALGFGAALAMLAAATTREAQGGLRIAGGAIAVAEARAAAEAGTHRAATGLAAAASGQDGPPAPPLDGGVQAWRFGEATVTIRARAERTATDLNAASAPALAAVARDAGLGDPEGFAAAVLARRRRLAEAGISWRVAPRAFDVVDQARALVPPEAWARLRPMLTAHGGRSAPDTVPAAPRRGENYGVIVEANVRGAHSVVTAVVRIAPDGRPRMLDWR